MICYRITNRGSGKAYIGSTTRSLKKRWQQHAAAKTVIGQAIRKHGRDAFTMEEIACARSHDDLLAVETAIILAEGTLAPRGYNVAIDARNGMYGRRHSPEAKAKMGVKVSAGLKAAYANGRRKSQRGYVASEETRAKLSAVNRGHAVSSETREKIAATKRGQTISPEQRAKLSAATKAAWARGDLGRKAG